MTTRPGMHARPRMQAARHAVTALIVALVLAAWLFVSALIVGWRP